MSRGPSTGPFFMVKEITGIKILKRFKINGIVLYPFIFYADSIVDPIVQNHERIHIEQIQRDGVFKFYLSYLWSYFKLRLNGQEHHLAYLNIPYEAEAYSHQRDFNYQVVKPNSLS